MEFLVGLALLAVLPMGLLAGRWYRQVRINRLRNQTRRKVIEAQMAGFRAAQRISAAEQMARRRMHAEASNVFGNPTIYEAPRPWR